MLHKLDLGDQNCVLSWEKDAKLNFRHHEKINSNVLTPDAESEKERDQNLEDFALGDLDFGIMHPRYAHFRFYLPHARLFQ